MFTRASVHCADRMVAASSSNGLRWSSSHPASGYSALSRRFVSRARPAGCPRSRPWTAQASGPEAPAGSLRRCAAARCQRPGRDPALAPLPSCSTCAALASRAHRRRGRAVADLPGQSRGWRPWPPRSARSTATFEAEPPRRPCVEAAATAAGYRPGAHHAAAPPAAPPARPSATGAGALELLRRCAVPARLGRSRPGSTSTTAPSPGTPSRRGWTVDDLRAPRGRAVVPGRRVPRPRCSGDAGGPGDRRLLLDEDPRRPPSRPSARST